MKFKRMFPMMALLLALTVIVAGCGVAAPKEALEKAYQASMEMNTASFEGELSLDFTPPASLLDDPNVMMTAEFLKNAEFKVRGTHQLDPFQAEMFLDINLKGDLAMQLSIPMVMTEDKMWVKVPNIPMFPLPQEIVGKFVELDFKELSELSGGELPEDYNPFDMELQTQFSTELFAAFMKHFEEETYFSNVKAEDVTLPESVNAEQIVKFEVTNEQAQEGATIIIEQVVPEILTIMADPKYNSIMNGQAEMEQLKADFEANKQEILDQIETLDEVLTINEFNMITAIDKNNYMPYSELNLNLDITQEGETATFGLKASGITTNINEEPTWEIGIPQGDDIITMQEIEEMFFMGF